MSTGISTKKRHGGGVSGFVLGCGCKDAKSVSVSSSASASASSPSATGTSATTATQRRGSAGTNPSASTTTDSLTLTSASSSFLFEDVAAEFDYSDGDLLEISATTRSTPSFSGLLRELNELEQSVASWARKSHHERELSPPPPPLPEYGEVRSGGKASEDGGVDSVEEVGLDGSVTVVKQSEDPLGDFRKSMLQMILENGIVVGEDLRAMLDRFLSLNSPCHHDAILRAFAEIWDNVFVASLAATLHVLSSLREPAAAAPARPAIAMPRTPPPPRHRQPTAWRV